MSAIAMLMHDGYPDYYYYYIAMSDEQCRYFLQIGSGNLISAPDILEDSSSYYILLST